MVYNGANPVHRGFGDSVGADPFLIEERVAKRQFIPLKAFRLLRNSLSIPSGYKTILTESCYYYPAIKKRMAGLRSDIINVNCGPLLYNIMNKRLSGMEARMLTSLLREVKAHIVLGSYGAELVEKIDPGKPVGIAYPYISDERMAALALVKPDLESKEITIMATNDIVTKGLDIAIAAFNRALESEPNLVLNIAGNVRKEEIERFDVKRSGRINYLGTVSDIGPLMAKTSIYIQPSRGDMFPVAPLEAMAAGVPAIVSDETGTRETVALLDPEMVCKTNEKDLAERMMRHMGMSAGARAKLSGKARESARRFTKKEQLDNFRKHFAVVSGNPLAMTAQK